MSEYGDKMKRGTPWGTPDSCREIASGIIFYSTPSHGGFWLSTERRNEIHPVLRKQDGWYEEDAEWSKVVLGFPDIFPRKKKRKLCPHSRIIFRTVMKNGPVKNSFQEKAYSVMRKLS